MLLLDTHIWIWWVTQTHERFKPNVRDFLQQTTDSLSISAMSVYEISILTQRQRVSLTLPLAKWLTAATIEAGIQVLPVTQTIAQHAGILEPVHGDPIDRMIVATALTYDIQLISQDGVFPRYAELQNRLLF